MRTPKVTGEKINGVFVAHRVLAAFADAKQYPDVWAGIEKTIDMHLEADAVAEPDVAAVWLEAKDLTDEHMDGRCIIALHLDHSGVFLARYGEYEDNSRDVFGWFEADYSDGAPEFDYWMEFPVPPKLKDASRTKQYVDRHQRAKQSDDIIKEVFDEVSADIEDRIAKNILARNINPAELADALDKTDDAELAAEYDRIKGRTKVSDAIDRRIAIKREILTAAMGALC